LIFIVSDAVLEQIANHRAEEKPPQVERAIEALKSKRFDEKASPT